MNKKSFSLILVGILTLTLSIFALYSRVYNTSDDIIELENNIKKFMNTSISKLEIKQVLNLDNKKYVLLIVNNSLGESELTKGINNKYKIETTGHGSGSFRHGIYKTNKGNYLVLKGRNYKMKISYINVMIDDREYTINISTKDEYFIAYCTLPDNIQSSYSEINKMKFFDENDVDITENIYNFI